jgi:hypothetical protein
MESGKSMLKKAVETHIIPMGIKKNGNEALSRELTKNALAPQPRDQQNHFDRERKTYMQKTTQLCQILAVSIAVALAVPAFAQSQSRTPGLSNPPAASPSGGETMKAPRSGEASVGDKAATQADSALNLRIRQALSSDSTLAATASKIHLESDNGEVTLHGSVATDEQKSDIVNKISQMSGVKKVHDQLKVGV